MLSDVCRRLSWSVALHGGPVGFRPVYGDTLFYYEPISQPNGDYTVPLERSSSIVIHRVTKLQFLLSKQVR